MPRAPRMARITLPRLGPSAADRAERDDRRGDRVRLGADQRVLAVAEVHREQVAVHVVALPAGQVVLLAEVELAHQHRVADRPDPVAGAAGAQGEVDVVVEDEVRRVGQADRVDHLAAEQEALEGDVLQLDPRGHRVPVAVVGLDHRAASGRIDQGCVRSKSVAAFSTSRPWTSSRTAIRQASSCGHQHRQAVGGRARRRRPSARSGRSPARTPPRTPARNPPAPPVFSSRWIRWSVQAAVGVEHLAGVVRAGVVDDDHRVGLVGLRGQAVEHPAEQVGAVVGDDDDGDGHCARSRQEPPVAGEVAAQRGAPGVDAEPDPAPGRGG